MYSPIIFMAASRAFRQYTFDRIFVIGGRQWLLMMPETIILVSHECLIMESHNFAITYKTVSFNVFVDICVYQINK